MFILTRIHIAFTLQPDLQELQFLPACMILDAGYWMLDTGHAGSSERELFLGTFSVRKDFCKLFLRGYPASSTKYQDLASLMMNRPRIPTTEYRPRITVYRYPNNYMQIHFRTESPVNKGFQKKIHCLKISVVRNRTVKYLIMIQAGMYQNNINLTYTIHILYCYKVWHGM